MIDERLVEERFVRASGPGGQHVNKVSTAVELRYHVSRVAWPAWMLERLKALAGGRLTADGVLVIESREHRTQAQNRVAARARLAALLRHAATPPKARRPTKPRAAVREQRLASKRRRADVKQSRRERPPEE